MRTFTTLLAATAALATTAAAADVNGFINKLNSLNLTSLVGAITTIQNTTAGKQLLSVIQSNTPLTVLAPTNNAFAGVNPYFGNDPVWLGQALAYHVIKGSVKIADIARYPENSVYTTYLSDKAVVNHKGDQPQYIGLVRNGNDTFVTNQNDVPSRLVSTSMYKNIVIHKVTTVVDLPPQMKDALTWSGFNWTADLSGIVGFVPADTLNRVGTTPSVTLFAPNNQALADAQSHGRIPSNITSTDINNLINNHVISGNVVFTGSPQKDYTSAGGQTITVGKGGAFGNVVYYRGQLVANIIHPDIITQNGVVHIIDAVLPNFKGPKSSRFFRL